MSFYCKDCGKEFYPKYECTCLGQPMIKQEPQMYICPNWKICMSQIDNNFPWYLHCKNHTNTSVCNNSDKRRDYSNSLCPACIPVEPEPTLKAGDMVYVGIGKGIVVKPESGSNAIDLKPAEPTCFNCDSPKGKILPICHKCFDVLKANMNPVESCYDSDERDWKPEPAEPQAEMPLMEQEQIELLDLMGKGVMDGLESVEVTKLISLWYRWYMEQRPAHDQQVRKALIEKLWLGGWLNKSFANRAKVDELIKAMAEGGR